MTLTGATAATLSVTANSGTDGAFYCVVTNTLDATKSTAASDAGGLGVVEPTITATIIAAGAALPNTAGLVASVASQAAVTY
jgi:hypothetical protein